MANIIGTNGNDTLLGSKDADTIKGLAGNDLLQGGTGNDILIGDAGNNFLVGGSGDDELNAESSTGNNTLDGGAGNDYFNADDSSGNNVFFGGDGNDSFSLSSPSTAPSSLVTQTVDGGIGEDSLSFNYYYSTGGITSTFNAITNIGSITAGTNRLNYKNLERLYLNATIYDDNIVGTNGNDYLAGGNSGNDTIFGGQGNDELLVYSSTTNDSILNGGAGSDRLSAISSKGDNLLSGGDGNDFLDVSGYFDSSKGKYTLLSSGNNTLNGGAGNDTLSASGSTGDNLLSGGDGNDSLGMYAASGNNTLNGGAGNDTLSASGSTGDNLLSGGDGNDRFYFTAPSTPPSSLVTQTVDGGIGEDLVYVDNAYIIKGITTTFDATTNSGSITSGTNRINYKNIEQLYIKTTAYDDNIVGSNGNDTISRDQVDGGNNTIDGGNGDDYLFSYNSGASKAITTTFNATTNSGSISGTNRVRYKNIERLNIVGTAYNDLIVGTNGNDTIDGASSGNDTIDGGNGDDLFTFGNYFFTDAITTTFNATTNIGSVTSGTNRVNYKNIERLNIIGGDSDDNIVGSNGNDTINGRGGNNTIFGGAGKDYLTADFANDSNSNVNNLFSGGDGNDSLDVSGSYDDYRGNFSLIAISGKNTLNGGAGDDNLVTSYSSGANLLFGDNGNDTLTASGSDSLYSLYGVYTVSGNNTLNGGAGDDRLIVDYSSGDNLLDGGDGNDTLKASNASGKNTLKGGNGNDYLTGGKGNDSLIGGDDTDTFAFNSFNEGVDTLYDFNATNELIQVSAAGFGGGLSTSSLRTSQFTLGTSATTTNQRFIYDFNTGALYFDLDGSASGFTQVKFAQLSGGVSLTAKNFAVV